jgi:diguanylate cyclase (GGDEF)-like protein
MSLTFAARKGKIMAQTLDIDIFSLLVLAVVLASHLGYSHDSLIRRRFFRGMVLAEMAALFVHVLVTIMAGRGSSTAYFALWSVYLLGGVVFCLMWVLLCAARYRPAMKKYEFLLLLIPLLAAAMLIAVNPANGIVFTVSAAGTSAHGPLFPVFSACIGVYAAYGLYLLLRQRKSLQPGEVIPYLVIPLIAAAAGLVQALLNTSVMIAWPAAALALLVMQMRMLGEKANIDHLTGLYNRKYIDEFIEDLLDSGGGLRGSHNFAALMLDIDGFKKINDSFGHLEGDRAIVTAAALLKKSVRKGDFVARYGGDEFLVILDRCSSVTPRRVIQRITDSLGRYNSGSAKPYKLEFSIGCQLFSGNTTLTAKDIFSSIDELMYRNKQSKTSVKS